MIIAKSVINELKGKTEEEVKEEEKENFSFGCNPLFLIIRVKNHFIISL